MVPAAAVNVTFTPVDQLPVVSVTVLGLDVMAVLPLRVSVTTTLPVGAWPSRMFDVPVPPLARFSVAGFTTMVRGEVEPSTVNGISAVEVDSGGDGVVERRGLRRVTAGRERRIGEAVGRAGVGAHERAIDAELHAAHRASCRWQWPRAESSRHSRSAVRSSGWSGSRWAACWLGGVAAAVAGRAIQRERRGHVVSAAERAVEARGEAATAADAAVPVGVAGDRQRRAARRLREGDRPAVLQSLPVRKIEDQRPAVGDGRAVVGDDDLAPKPLPPSQISCT